MRLDRRRAITKSRNIVRKYIEKGLPRYSHIPISDNIAKTIGPAKSVATAAMVFLIFSLVAS